jgi:putative membrane protein insertion efficiency factor
MIKFLSKISNLINFVILLFINLYQNLIRPFFKPLGCCRFSPTCSKYAEECFQKLPFWQAIPKSIWRVLRCNPLFEGGIDPVSNPKKGI